MPTVHEQQPVTAQEVADAIVAGKDALSRFEASDAVLDAVANFSLILDRARIVELTKSLEAVQKIEQQFGAIARQIEITDLSESVLSLALNAVWQARAGLGSLQQRSQTIRMATSNPDVIRVATSLSSLSSRLLNSLSETARSLGKKVLAHTVQRLIEESGNPEGFDVFDWVERWVDTPLPALLNQRPEEFLSTAEGQSIIFGLVSRIQSGTYA